MKLKPIHIDILIALMIGAVSGIVGYYTSKYLREPARASLKASMS